MKINNNLNALINQISLPSDDVLFRKFKEFDYLKNFSSKIYYTSSIICSWDRRISVSSGDFFNKIRVHVVENSLDGGKTPFHVKIKDFSSYYNGPEGYWDNSSWFHDVNFFSRFSFLEEDVLVVSISDNDVLVHEVIRNDENLNRILNLEEIHKYIIKFFNINSFYFNKVSRSFVEIEQELMLSKFKEDLNLGNLLAYFRVHKPKEWE